MATNKNKELGIQLPLAVAVGVLSGDPVIVGNITGVALTDRDANGNASVDLMGTYNLSVKGVNDAGNVAVAAGDAIYYIDADTPKLSRKSSGRLFGMALGAVLSGATTTIEVLLCRNPQVGQGDIAAAVQRGKLFISAEQTGTGAPQNIAHGLGVVPSKVFAAPTDLTPATVGSYVITEGAHDATNVIVTVTLSKKFKVLAIA
jgi:predicted RecA/RadA family phage recombinase